MQQKKKQGVGANKNFGPIQKLSVPDFQHITNQYEQMQNEILDNKNRKRKQIKQFSIRKLTNPNQMRSSAQAAADALVEARQQDTSGVALKGVRDPNSLLTEEEHEALKPQEVKVENPWIYKQTHQEYLDNIKGLPARHANVIQQHENVKKNQTFIPKIEELIDKDQATKDAVALLNKEYEIFNTPGLPGVKVLTRYDTWEEDKSVEEWVAYCRQKPGQAHALSPVYQGYEYCWKPVEVLSYEYKERKFKVKVIATGQEKFVTRLSLLFFNEDPDKFKERVNQCKQRQEIVEAELRFTDLVDSVPTDAVSTLSKVHRFDFLKKSVRDSDKFDPDKIYDTFKGLLRVVEEEYIRQMKKCVILKEMEDPANFQKFDRLKVPIRLSKKTSPYFGVVRCPKYDFSYHNDLIQDQHYSSDEALVDMTRIFIQKCIDFQEFRFLQTKLDLIKTPNELDDLERIQKEHHKAVSTNMQIQWREFLVGEIMERLRGGHDFFMSEDQRYEESGLKRIITRFEYIMNTHLRDFVKLSIDDWVEFIRYFTNPNLNNDELWKINKRPCITIHLAIKKKEKKKDKKKEKKDKEKAKEEDGAALEEDTDDDKNKVIFSPTIQKCQEFVLSTMDWIVESTNKICSLEHDLMPFLEKPVQPNFQINSDFPWIVDAKEQLTKMIQANIQGPLELLEQFKKFEYIINTDKKALIEDLFKGGEGGTKKPLEEIKAKIEHYDQAYYDIMTLAQDDVDFKIFSVICKKLKKQLGNEALEIKQKILDETYKYCATTVEECTKTYEHMQDRIEHDPTTERELVDTQDFIQGVAKMQEELIATLKNVEKHHELLDSFSHRYDEADIHDFYYMKVWPQQITASLGEGRQRITQRKEEFNQRLETEKEQFEKQLQIYEQNFEKIKKFQSKAALQDYLSDCYTLKSDIDKAHNTVKQFNDREHTFDQEKSLYPKLDDLDKAFQPFSDLIIMGHNVQRELRDWSHEKLAGRDPDEIKGKIQEWQQKCNKLAKKLDEQDYGETAEVARDICKDVNEFSKNLPLIECFTAEAVAKEDWDEIVELIGQPGYQKEDVQVNHFEQYSLFQHVAEIQDITTRAKKKFGLRQTLQNYKKEMRDFQLEQKEYKDTFLLKGFDDVQAKLDEIIVGTQTMLGSSYMKGSLKHETGKWETTLNNISEVLEAMMKTQRNWMYLEPIFASGDIAMTMPTEAKDFNSVDGLWKKTMEGIQADPGIMEIQEKDNIKQQFEDANRKLDKIQKHLNDYLEQKRLIFARFFFLGSDELLKILANTKDPYLVQPYMNKCFEGIAEVQFDENVCVHGMVSEEGEVVGYLKKIDVNDGDRKGNVEKWMLDIEDQMKSSLKDLAKQSLETYPNKVRTEWATMWPGQIVLAGSQIFWTTEVEKAIQNQELDAYYKVQQAQIEEIVQMVRTPLKSMERVTIKALVVIDVHARDVVDQMFRDGVQTVYEFGWSSQLRYYWEEKDTLRVKMVTAIIPYAYEYLGNSPRLVITSLTDRCYRTLLGAKYLNYGGAPEGPAGTGKTESVKDLAKAIAVQCVVFNCSDGIDYIFMATYFKGLAQSGAWCCFDEFNRINVEVLSVIAQQIQVIQDAIKQPKVRQFTFMGTVLGINRSCNVNITMNPGYAGRSELPDNLKALFRPCAMMVPDYALIAEIELYSFGFSEAAPLSVKVVASLRLSSEQLSSQDHYDFGMRAVKSILNACGNNRRNPAMDTWPEDLICLKALNDVNLPKFTSNDIPLYQGITSDLFPGAELKQQDYSALTDQMKEYCKKVNIQPKPIFLQKCIELYETHIVRHGLMVVGDPYAGKSCVIKTLAEGISGCSIKDSENYQVVDEHYVNPKSITQNQLYGVYDMDSQEWSDGVLAIKIRDCAESSTPNKKWICFDGPVDAVWIENMNTVLDDNKKLCLNSGQIIKLKPTMTIMFQTDDLSQASPATVSRCGMVLLESQQLGHSVFLKSYCIELRKFIDAKIMDKFEPIFNYIIDVCVEFVRQNCTTATQGNGSYCSAQVIRLIECYISRFKPVESDEENKAEAESQLPKDIDDKLYNAFLYALIWGIGGIIEESGRSKFNEFLQKVIAGDEVIETHGLDLGQDDDNKQKSYEPMKLPNKLGEFQSIYEIYFDMEEMKWTNWMNTIDKYVVNKEDTFLMLSIPTVDTVRLQNICTTLLVNQKHALLVGPTGTGKSVSIQKMLQKEFDNSEYTYFPLGFSAQTTHNQTERIIDGQMEKKKRGVYGPKFNRKGIIFVDDLNMPQKETYGAQGPIELLRQYMDYQGWYDIDNPEREFRQLINCRFVAAMSRNTISGRYVRHFNAIYCEPYAESSLQLIFTTILDWLFAASTNPVFPQPVQSLKNNIVESTVLIYNRTKQSFRPTPAKSHYSYNLRDISKVFQGISKASGKSINKEDDMIKLWAHESSRVFQDRLISNNDRDEFQTLLNGVLKEKFKREWTSLVKVEPLLFSAFVPGLCFPGGDTSKKPFNDVYCELYDREKTKRAADESLSDYNTMNPSRKMDLVLFFSAIEHVVKIHRIITTEFGHALLIGVGGSGRKSLTMLAVSIATFETYQIEVTKNYDFKAWRENMRDNLFGEAGTLEKSMIFLLSDTQIVVESFLEDINNILNNGEIPNLYSTNEEINAILDTMSEQNKNVPNYKQLGPQEIWADFITKCKQNVHVVLAMSPIGEDFRRRLRMFPSLVNCCAIDYFLPWPQDALQSVAEYFLKEVDDLPEYEGIVKICVDMQMRVTDLSVKFRNNEKRHFYVTPTSYLVLIKAFQRTLGKKRDQIDTIINKYDKGITQLSDAKDKVSTLQQQLDALMPQLEEAQKVNNVIKAEVEAKKIEVAAETKLCDKEAESAKEVKSKADQLQYECEFELSNVMPIFQKAQRAVSQLSPGDVTEVKGFKTPSKGAFLVVQTLCIIFGFLNPKKKGTGKDAEYDWWELGKQKVLNGQLLKNCQNLDKNLDPERVEKLRPLVNSPEYDEKELQRASKGVLGLGRWVAAMVQYFDAMKVVRPKEKALEEAKAQADAAQKSLDEAMAKLAAVQAEMARLVEKLDAAIAEEKRLSTEFETAKKRFNRAIELIDKLKNEEVSWKEALIKNRANKVNLTGDVIISAGVIAYLGVFTVEYRMEAIKSWLGLCKDLDIKATEDFKIKDVLGVGTTIQTWHIQGLPQEDFAIENAIIIENSARWPLMIDPQMQAYNWIRGMEKDLTIVKPTTDATLLQRKVKFAIMEGHAVLLADANESFDPVIEPVLGKQLTKQGNMTMIKIGEENTEYNFDFRFYVTTKLSKPHYAPEVCVMVNILNFMVTEDGLKDQMLNQVVEHEEPRTMEKSKNAIKQKAENDRKRAELEDKILTQIATSEVDILDDDILMVALDESKTQQKIIEVAEKQDEATMTQFRNAQQMFELVAYRASRLFFVLIQIMNVNDMYQYSLKYYKQIFHTSLEAATEKNITKKNERRDFFRAEFTRQLYQNICRSLFEEHKLLFSFLICLKIKDEVDETFRHDEVRFLLIGITKVETDRPNPTGEGGWMTDKTWAGFCQLSEDYDTFKGIDKNVEANLDKWSQIYNSAKPHSKKIEIPAPFDKLNLMQKGMLLRVLRPDKVINIIQKLIKQEKELGPSFIKPPTFDMRKTYSDSKYNTPIIIVLSPGADPMGEMQKLASLENQTISGISLGQGQEKIAIEKIQEAQQQQQWVVLQNCHLCPSFMPTLDGLIEKLDDLDRNTKFRLWLTSMPSNQFPVTILQGGVKATIEPPKGLRNNLLRSYTQLDANDFENVCEKPSAYKSLMWGLCFFNALIIERRKFGPLGWNLPYAFSNSDLEISQAQLIMFLNHFDEIPWIALKYMVSEANYGGRVTQTQDRRLINTIMDDFYCPAMLKKNHRMTECEKYIVPDEGPLENYISYIENELPINDLTEVFGLHDNAEITSQIGITNTMLSVALSVSSSSGGGGAGGKDSDTMLMESADEIINKLPPNYDMELASKKHPLKYLDSMNTVLQQELLRYNRLNSVVQSSLKQAKLAIKGEVPLTPDIEALITSVLQNRQPAMWGKKSYPSLKPLASYIMDLVDRLAFMQKWIDEGAPANTRISALFFTQSFMTGAKQNFARKYTIAIDTIDFTFKVVNDEKATDLTKHPEDGVYVYGLFVEGCRWNEEKAALDESHPKVLYTKMKSIHIVPKKKTEINHGHSYMCPVYKTAARFGTLTTTGHSSNFVVDVYLPIQKKHKERHWIKRGVAMLTMLSD